MLYLEKTKEGDAMIRIAVVDDEKDMRELLCRRLTEELSRLNVDFAVNEYDSGESFIDDHSKGIVFDMLFLDIQLSDCTGMDVARKLREQGSGVLLVFVTSFDNYVFEAFDYEAQAYLRKSELDVRFRSAVEKLVKKYTESHKEIVLHNLDSQLRIALTEIAYFESRQHTITMFADSGKTFAFTGSLSKLEKDLRTSGFFRIHSGFLVNTEYVYSIEKNEAVIRFSGEAKRIPISRSKLKEFKEFYQRSFRGV